MRLAAVSNSLINSVLARPVLDDRGMILLGEGVTLSERLVDRLKSLGVYNVYIQDQRTADISVEDPISEKTRRSAIQTVQESVEQLRLQSSKNPKFASRQDLGRRNHRNEYLPHETLEYLMGGSGTLFDHSLITLFVKNVAIYPIGMTVALNNGQTAVVVAINPEYPQRPVVRPITDTDGTSLETARDIDLTKNLTLMISGTES